MSSSSRHVQIKRTTELPSKTFHITNHHYKPIRYIPGVEYSRDPDVEHKVISGGTLESMSRTGPKGKQTVVVHRTAVPVVEQQQRVTSYPATRHHVVKSSSSSFGGAPVVERTVTSSSRSGSQQPSSFSNLQRSMEDDLNRRKSDWESEVEKMQHSFFDMKTTDNKKQAFGDSSGGHQSQNQILTVGDSKKLFSDQQDGSKLFRQKFDLHGFDTDDLTVSAEGGKLTITASREENMDGATSTRKFNRTVDIPECVDTDQISSYLDDDGILTIEAPVDESKLPKVEPTIVHRTETLNSDAPTSFESSFDRSPGFEPPQYERIIESRSGGGAGGTPSSFTSSTRTRYLGPDVEDTPHGRKLKTSLYIGKKYKPDDITVKLYDYKINIDAKSEELIGGRTSRRQFGRDVDIPGPVERDTFQAMLGEDGRLYMGGSFSGNDDHQAVAESVDADMPSGGRSVNIMY